jgi:hypothetical protein
MYSSQITPRTNLNWRILTAAIIPSHSTENCSHEIFNSQDQIFSNYEPSTAVSHLELACKHASISAINPWSDTRETLQLLRHCWNSWHHCWRGHVTLPHSCVIQEFIAVVWQQMRWGDARLSSAWRKHCFVYCCIIVGACFDVTVLAWHKYATIYLKLTSCNMFHLCRYILEPTYGLFIRCLGITVWWKFTSHFTYRVNQKISVYLRTWFSFRDKIYGLTYCIMLKKRAVNS